MSIRGEARFVLRCINFSSGTSSGGEMLHEQKCDLLQGFLEFKLKQLGVNTMCWRVREWG